MKQILILSLLVLFPISLYAQFDLDLSKGHYCELDTELESMDIEIDMPSRKASDFVEKIMNQVGLPRNFKVVVSKDIPNAIAFQSENGKRYIIYNEDYLDGLTKNNLTDWGIVFTFAHEIGHHLCNHVIDDDKSRHEEELQADEFAGNILYKLGADVDEATLVSNALSINYTDSHPGRKKRFESIFKGWTNAKESAGESFDEQKEKCKVSGAFDANGEVIFYNATKKTIYIKTIKSFTSQTMNSYNITLLPGQSDVISQLVEENVPYVVSLSPLDRTYSSNAVVYEGNLKPVYCKTKLEIVKL